MQSYLNLLTKILNEGEMREDRTGVGTLSLFGHQTRYNLENQFPLLTTKKVHLKSIIHELLWFLNGDTNVKSLQKHDVKIWNEWADESGDLGRVYGAQWRTWKNAKNETVDQILNLVNNLKNDPHSRRHLVVSYNPGELDQMALPPCHAFFQFYVGEDKTLSCQMYQRSADVFLGVPFNIASYALLTYMVAQVCDLKPKEFIHTLGDAHIYLNHLEQVKLQLSRKPRTLPQITLNPTVKNIFDFEYEDFELQGYDPQGRISAPVAV